MSSWKIAFHPQAKKEFADLQMDIKAKFARIFGLVDQFGLDALQMPYARPLRGKIWEMRASGKDGIARSLYAVSSGRTIYILACFVKKVQQTPPQKIDLAKRRLLDLED
jgi:phage-related protein